LTERGLGRGDLQKDIDAVAVGFDHARDALDLPRDPSQLGVQWQKLQSITDAMYAPTFCGSSPGA
jgi:hypothetical protein